MNSLEISRSRQSQFTGSTEELVTGPDAEVRSALRKLIDYCQANDWAGYDPYDALNSQLLTSLPFLNSKLPRLALTQLLKRSPVNIRALARIPKTQNPKAIALFLSSFVKLSALPSFEVAHLVDEMIARLAALRSPDIRYWSWGYSFPWQGRSLLVPAAAPNLVCTAFVASSLLDVYEQRDDERCLAMAVSAAEYILNELYWTNENGRAGFSYPLPSQRSEVHNANLLAAALLCRVHKHTGARRFLDPGLKAARYSVARQRSDGWWYYGELASQRWIDNFHTGYNLSALRHIQRYADTNEFEESIRRGFDFYRAHFFREDGAPRYFHNRTYPIDIHCVAQSILSLLQFQDLDTGNLALAQSVFRWAMAHMWDDRGFFCYRVLRIWTIRISYMRWSQAWMLLALSTLVCESGSSVTYKNEIPASPTPITKGSHVAVTQSELTNK